LYGVRTAQGLLRFTHPSAHELTNDSPEELKLQVRLVPLNPFLQPPICFPTSLPTAFKIDIRAAMPGLLSSLGGAGDCELAQKELASLGWEATQPPVQTSVAEPRPLGCCQGHGAKP